MKSLIAPIALFALAFGYEEATIVLYLRQIATRTLMPGAQVLAFERGREASTLVVLLGVAWLCGRERRGLMLRAFFLAFGLWDVAYYVFLYVLSGYPTLGSPDVLFLLPVPWIAPVWAAASFAVILVLAGIFGVRPRGGALFAAGLLLGVGSFVARGSGLTHAYPVALFIVAAGLSLAGVRFTRAAASG